MHELEFDAQMIQPLMDILGQLHPERAVESGNIAHHLGLSEHMVVSKQRFIGRAIERDDITKHPAMLGLQITELPVDAFRCDNFIDLIELLAEQRQLLLGPFTANAVE